MAAQVWPFLIARGRQRGYSVLLAPRFLLAEGDYGFLEQATGPVRESAPVQADVATSRRGRRLGLVWSEHRVTAEDLSDTEDPYDEHSRPLLLLYGFVCADTTVSAPHGAGLDHARRVALDTYRQFLTDENGFTTQPSAPFDTRSPAVSGAVPFDRSPTVASAAPFDHSSAGSDAAAFGHSPAGSDAAAFDRSSAGSNAVPFDRSSAGSRVAPFAGPAPSPRPVRRLVIAAAAVVGAAATAVIVAVAAGSGGGSSPDPPRLCAPPTTSAKPTAPATSARPTTPARPTDPATSAKPVVPAEPTTSTRRTTSAKPTTPSSCGSTTLITTPDHRQPRSPKLHG
jgi:hypothetical protein